VTQANINARAIAAIPIALPSLDAQNAAVKRFQELETGIDETGRQIVMADRLCSIARGAILAKAFAGELVPTEAELARAEGRSYESGEELLARIRAKRAATGLPRSARKLRAAAVKGRPMTRRSSPRSATR